MAASLDDLKRALVNADAAGDVEGARALAGEITRLQPQQSAIPSAITSNPAVINADASAALGSGMVASALGGLAGAAGTVLPGPEGQGTDWAQKVQNALTYEPRTTGAQAVTHAISSPFELLAKGADKAGGFVTDQAAKVLPAGLAADLGTATNVGIQALPAAVGKIIPKAAGTMKPAPNPALEAAARLGIKVTPEEAGAGVVSKTAASLAGEPRLARKISTANEAKVNATVVEDLKLPKDTELSHDTLEGIRDAQAPVYEKLRKAGTVDFDQALMKDMQEIVKDYEGASKDFPRGKNPVMEVYQRLTQNADGSLKRSFDANSAVSEIKNLRKDAKKAYAQQDFELGGANIDAARALESALDRHLSKPTMGSDGAGIPGDTQAVSAFRETRQLIAKTYDVEKALGPQGNINPQALAKMLEKGRPLSGGLLEIAKAAKDFPRSLQKPSMQATGPTYHDFALGLGGGLLHAAKVGAIDPVSGALVAAGTIARPAARSLIASRAYQSMMQNPGSLAEALAGSGEALPIGGVMGQTNSRR